MKNPMMDLSNAKCDINSDGDLSCEGIKEPIKVEIDGEKPTDGKIIFSDGKVTVTEELVFNGGNSSSLVPTVTLSSLCGDPISYTTEGQLTLGDKYQCKVKDEMETGFEEGYYFYILSYNDTDGNVIVGEDGKAIDDPTNAKSVNLIMDRNIYYDESTDTSIGATSINTEFIEWNSGSFRDGPVTAMDYLYNATKAWTNVLDIEMNYTDEGNGYGKVITSDGVTKITKKDGTSVIVLTNQVGYNNLKARMPYKSEVSDYDSTNQTNAYLYDNLDSNGGITYSGNIEDIYGYWILSSDLEDTSAEYACFVFYEGRVYSYWAR